ncbi:MAG: hypothetical protein B7Y93_00370 [Micrococcales bacterium 32-70-13]|nr:MAG: hypothetical protein B7Y93_00370 [Micrococcales bacterium 32-70-13]
MTLTAYIFGVAAALGTLAVVVEMLRRNRLRERHAVWWLIAGTMALIVGLFPGVLAWAANLIGIEVPTNLVFFVSVAVLFLVCIQHSAELTALESKTRILAEQAALTRLRIEELERELRKSSD